MMVAFRKEAPSHVQEVIPMNKSRAYRSTSVKNVSLARVLAGREGQVPIVGCDVSKREIMVVLRWGGTDFERPWRVKNPSELGLLRELLQQLRGETDLVVALEPTGCYGDPFRQALSDAGISTHRVSPKLSHDYAEIFDGVPSQHDGKDAAIVAELSAIGKSRIWEFSAPSELDREMAYWVDWYDVQRRNLKTWYGRLESLLGRYWPEATETLPMTRSVLLECLAEYGGPFGLASDEHAVEKLWSWGRGRLRRQKAEQLVAGARSTFGVRQGTFDVLQLQQYAKKALDCRQELRRSRKALTALVEDHPVIQAQSPVVGVVTACVLWVYLGDPAAYDCGPAYRKAMGLNLTEYSSGAWQGRIRISKRGHGEVRRWIYFSALRWIKEEPIRSWYENKKAKKTGQDDDQVMRAIVAVMRKLALALYQVGAHGATFEPQLLFPGQASTHRAA
jgi:transposase